jgi:hypothetical protein
MVSTTSNKIRLRPVSPMEKYKAPRKKSIVKVQKISSENKRTSKTASVNPMDKGKGDAFWLKYKIE